MEKTLNGAEAAALCGFSAVWLHKLRQRGEGPPFERRGWSCEYSLRAVVDWIVRREVSKALARRGSND